MAKIKKIKSGFKPFGLDLNEDDTLSQGVTPEGEAVGFYKNQQVDYDVIIDEMEDRATTNKLGRKIKSRKLMFTGVDFEQLKKESE